MVRNRVDTALWPELTGVTEWRGQARLPRDPAWIVRFFALVEALDEAGAVHFAALVSQASKLFPCSNERLEGLAGWLPLSRVAAWAEDGRLYLHPATSALDLARRFGAWAHTQAVARDQVDALTRYSLGVVSTAVAELSTENPGRRKAPWPLLRQMEGAVLDPARVAIKARLGRILSRLDRSFLERQGVTRGALLGLLAGQHVLLLGPPGTAKSLLARSLCGVFADARYFEYLLSRFTQPDELFGPVSIPGLKDEDYRRLTDGFLPSAEVGFLDEIFKANSAILNALLTLMNERVFHHGRHRDGAPLIALIGASNEIPDAESGLDALYDRFLVRLMAPPLREASPFLQVVTGELERFSLDDSDRIALGELRAWRAASARVRATPEAKRALVEIWRGAAAAELQVSDRRWRQAWSLLQMAVWTDGRDEITRADLGLLADVLAPGPDQQAVVQELLQSNLSPPPVPEHDLRAQWLLLSADRVAPLDGELDQGSAAANWDQGLALRRSSLRRFFAHHTSVLEAAAQQRAGWEGERLWWPRPEVQWLSAHLSFTKDLSEILEIARAYSRDLEGPEAAVRALIARLPRVDHPTHVPRALRLAVPEAGVDVLLSADGTLLPPDPLMVAARTLPVLALEPRELLDLAEGRTTTRDVTARLPAWGAANARAALEAMRKSWLGSAIPAPRALASP